MGNSEYGPTVIRVILGLLMLIPGIDKLMGMLSGGHMIAEMLGSGLAWVVLLAEIIFGIAVLIGFKTKYTVWPIAIILLAAIFMVHLGSDNPMKVINILFHLLGVGTAVSLFLTGGGALAVDKE